MSLLPNLISVTRFNWYKSFQKVPIDDNTDAKWKKLGFFDSLEISTILISGACTKPEEYTNSNP